MDKKYCITNIKFVDKFLVPSHQSRVRNFLILSEKNSQKDRKETLAGTGLLMHSKMNIK
jgi:hypothetical protein